MSSPEANSHTHTRLKPGIALGSPYGESHRHVLLRSSATHRRRLGDPHRVERYMLDQIRSRAQERDVLNFCAYTPLILMAALHTPDNARFV